MITIKDIEDIELLQLFFEAFNGDSMPLEELTSKKEIEEIVENKFKVMEEDFFKKLDARLKQHMIMIEEAIASKYLKKSNEIKKEAVKPKSAIKTFRTYRKKHKPFTLKGLNDDGTFVQSRGKPLTFTIQKVIRLKKLIPQTEKYPNFASLSEEMGLPLKTTVRLSYLTEIGNMEKWIN